nr:hypothetical protein [Tanacetum cinerariifolium]
KVKLDELGGILKNKARLVACGYRQEEGIDFEESFALVARLEAIRIFLAYFPPANRKVSTGSRNFPTANRKFSTASRKFPTGSTKSRTANMGMKGKVIIPQLVGLGSLHRTHLIKATYPTSLIMNHLMEDMCLSVKEDARLHEMGTPRQHNMYSIDLNNIVPHRDLTCLVAKASADECMLWHRRLVTDDFSRFTWTFFLKSKDEASNILKKFITEIENLKDLKVKIIRRNRTLIEAARTMLADAKLSVTFWAEAVNTACYVQNRVLVNKSHYKTPYGLFNGRSPAIGFLKPFGCHVMILNTLDHLGKFEEKGNEGTKDTTSQEVKKDVSSLRYIALPNWAHDALLEFSSSKPQDHCSTEVPKGSGNTNPTVFTPNLPADHMETLTVETFIPTVSSPVPTAYSTDSQDSSSDARLISKRVANQEETPSLDNILSLTNRFEDILEGKTNSDESNGVEADVSNLETTIIASPTPTLRIHKDHPKSQIIGHVDTPIQTRNKSKEISDALQDPSWVEAMQEELLQFKIQKVWTLVDCPKGVRPIGTKWVLKNKKDERGIVIRNKARLVAQGHTQEEGIDYDEVFAHVARIEAIRLFLAYASFMGFTVYQMDDPEYPAKVFKVEKAMYGLHQAPRAWYGTLSKYLLKNGFHRDTIDQTLFIRRQRGDFILVQVYVDDIIFGSSNP